VAVGEARGHSNERRLTSRTRDAEDFRTSEEKARRAWSHAGPRPPPIPLPLSSGTRPTNPGRACPPEGDAGRAEPELVPTRGTG